MIGEQLAPETVVETAHEVRELVSDVDDVWVGIQHDYPMVWFENGMDDDCQQRIIDTGFETVETVTIGDSIGIGVERNGHSD
jgi:hypothetical protein